MPFKDIIKKNEYRRKWYKLNKNSEKAHVKRRKKEIRRWFENFKKKLKCIKCLENHPAVLEFHHNNGEKENEISYMVGNGHSIGSIKKEMGKCIVLCSNCHRKLHFNNKKL